MKVRIKVHFPAHTLETHFCDICCFILLDLYVALIVLLLSLYLGI